MLDIDRLPSVKHGLWFHGGVSACHVRIVRHHLLLGSHDADDPPALADDQPMDCFYVRYDLPAWHARPAAVHWHDGGTALSLREALFLAQRKLGPVISWQD